MTQDECWLMKYNELMEFIKKSYRNPSCHRIEALNWIKANRKLVSLRELKYERSVMHAILLELSEKYKHVIQYV